jgi:hypothetical protein
MPAIGESTTIALGCDVPRFPPTAGSKRGGGGSEHGKATASRLGMTIANCDQHSIASVRCNLSSRIH